MQEGSYHIIPHGLQKKEEKKRHTRITFFCKLQVLEPCLRGEGVLSQPVEQGQIEGQAAVGELRGVHVTVDEAWQQELLPAEGLDVGILQAVPGVKGTIY